MRRTSQVESARFRSFQVNENCTAQRECRLSSQVRRMVSHFLRDATKRYRFEPLAEAADSCEDDYCKRSKSLGITFFIP